MIQIGKHELGQDQLKVMGGIDAPGDMDNVRVIEKTHHMGNRIDSADVPEELVPESLALARAFDKPGDVNKFQGRRDDFGGVFHLGKLVQPFVRDGNDSRIRINRAERKVCRRRAAFAQRIEKSRFPDVRESDETTCETHSMLTPLSEKYVMSPASPP